jgi:purine-binding chemotaxis protein CheW
LDNQLAIIPDQNSLPARRFQLPPGEIDLVCVQLDEQQFALYLPAVIEAIRMVKLTPMPGVSTALAGLLNLRGLIVPVMDLRVLLGLEQRRYDENTPIILLEFETRKRGLIVDAISEVIKVAGNLVQAPSGLVPHSEYIAAIVRAESGLMMVLDHTKLLKFEEEKYLDLVGRLR